MGLSTDRLPAELEDFDKALEELDAIAKIPGVDVLMFGPGDFSVLAGVRSMNEVFPLEHVAEAYDRMMGGKARFRVVLTTGQ